MAEIEPPAPVAPSLGTAALGEVVTISIGTEKKPYKIYKDLLCHHAEYFRIAYNGRWKEADEGVALEDVQPEVFNVFVHWLYTQQLPADESEFGRVAGIDVRKPFGCTSKDQVLLLTMYAFADRFMVQQLKRSVRNLFVDLTHEHAPWYETIIYAFNNISEDDPLTSYLVDLHCIRWQANSDTESEILLRVQLPHSFLVQVMVRSRELEDYDDAECEKLLDEYHDREEKLER